MGIFSKIFKGIGKIFGLGGQDDQAKAQKEQLRRMEEQNKLNAMNEAKKVTEFEEAPETGESSVDGVRRKKKQSGMYSSNIGLTI